MTSDNSQLRSIHLIYFFISSLLFVNDLCNDRCWHRSHQCILLVSLICCFCGDSSLRGCVSTRISIAYHFVSLDIRRCYIGMRSFNDLHSNTERTDCPADNWAMISYYYFRTLFIARAVAIVSTSIGRRIPIYHTRRTEIIWLQQWMIHWSLGIQQKQADDK